MSLSCGIIGLPNVGKSCVFNALTNAGAESANYPFCTIDPNYGVVTVPDSRLDQLADLLQPEQVIPATIAFVDIAGLVKGASEGKGKGNAFLSHIREADLLIHVVRCFEDPDVVHVEPDLNPLRDIDIIESELLFKDLETLERRIENARNMAKSGERTLRLQVELLLELKKHIEKGLPVRSWPQWDPRHPALSNLFFLTTKRIIYLCNIAEQNLPDGKDNPSVRSVIDHANTIGSPVIVACAQLEAEIAELEDEEKTDFLEAIGLEESGFNRLVRASYRELDRITFFTTRSNQLRAWTVRNGTKAPQAAGVIHTDMEKGFIRAETIDWHQLLETGSEATARERGLIRSEGREYPVRDGDVILFRFNV